jgi:hypothetical protein
MTVLPPAAAHLLGFARLLRAAGMAAAPDQVAAFLAAVALLGPRSPDDIRRAARCVLAPPVDRLAEFDALFDAWLHGGGEEVVLPEDGPDLGDPARSEPDPVPLVRGAAEGGALASAVERLGQRDLAARDPLAGFAAALADALPRRTALRDIPARRGGRFDLRRSLRGMVAADGDILRPALRRRARVARPLMLLIDISGSMKGQTDGNLRLAHAAMQAASRAEVLTLGTRLTRITPALRLRDPGAARAAARSLVPDWDGGTRIGPALLALLGNPRLAAFARGACIVLLSDGLERGSPAEFVTAMQRLSLRAHRLSLCTPLAADPRYRPRTAALAAVLPVLDDLVDGAGEAAVARLLLSLARPGVPAERMWRKERRCSG